MDETQRWALPALVVSFFLLGFVLPSLRLRLRSGKNAFVLHREGHPVQRVIGVFMALFMFALLLWAALYASWGPSHLGVWAASHELQIVGWAVVAVGLTLVLVAQAQMGASWRIGIDSEPTGLITRGLFGVVRNPIFSGMYLLLIGLVLLSPSAWTVMALPNYFILVSVQIRLEEQHLYQLHGDRYRSYAARVGRFLPGLGRGAPR